MFLYVERHSTAKPGQPAPKFCDFSGQIKCVAGAMRAAGFSVNKIDGAELLPLVQ